MFVSYHDIERGKQSYKAQKEAAAALGRDPDSMLLANLFYPVVGATNMEAEDKVAA